jgi:hypothetical protein
MPKVDKQQELKWLRSAQKKCAVFPRACPDANDEKPDFLFPEEDLGIEVVRYIQGQCSSGSPTRKRESIHQKLVTAAQKRFEAANDEQLEVHVFWSAEVPPKEAKFEYLIKSIVQIVTTLLAQGRDCWHPDLTRIDEIKLGQHLGQICIYQLKRTQGYWICDEAGAIGPDVERVQMLISQKDGRVLEYRTKCRFVWLLIVAENNHLSSIFSPEEDFAKATFRSLFDRVFLLDEFKNQVLEIPVSQLT